MSMSMQKKKKRKGKKKQKKKDNKKQMKISNNYPIIHPTKKMVKYPDVQIARSPAKKMLRVLSKRGPQRQQTGRQKTKIKTFNHLLKPTTNKWCTTQMLKLQDLHKKK